MMAFRHRLGGMVFAVLLSAVVPLGCAEVQAQTTVTHYVVIQPIDVCGTGGPNSTTGCSPFNTLTKSPDPTKATSTTPIGFVDTTTNVNLTRAFWLQIGVDVTFLPIVEYNNATYQTLDVTCAASDSSGNCTQLSSNAFKMLSSYTSAPSIVSSGCTSFCNVPLAPTTANAINLFFVNSLVPTSPLTGTYYGFAWLNGNGIAVGKSTFFNGLAPPRFDTLAHELGHNLNLDHTTFGAGTLCSGVVMPSPKGCNVMDAGTIRNLAASTGCTAASTTSNSPTGGALYDLDTGLCSPAAPDQIAGNLILGTSTTVQQGQALLSGFLNPIPNVNATAGGGDVSFTVTYPKIKQAGGRQGEYIFALVVALPQGFQFGSNIFTQTGGNAQVFGTPFVLNGNNGQGNSNCLKPLSGGPSIQCLEIDFVPGTFTANTSISFTSEIINKGTGQAATLTDLACTPPEPQQCLDLSYVFNDLLATTSAFVVTAKTANLTANSQVPDPGVPATIVNPANFPSVANLNPPLTVTGFTQTPCTLSGSSTTCPPQAGGGNPASAQQSD